MAAVARQLRPGGGGLSSGGAPQALEDAVATAIGSDPQDLSITLVPDPEAVREYLLGVIARDLPAPGRKVLMLGLDGLDWDLVLPYVQAGIMPNLQELLRIGTWGTMETIIPTLSPLIWTTMATGVSPDRHGILDFVEKDPARGVMVPITGRGRQVPALWNLASAFGRSVDSVGWWATWPAERIHGVQISDRLYYTLTQGLTKEVLREDLPEVVFPADRSQEFSDLRDRAELNLLVDVFNLLNAQTETGRVIRYTTGTEVYNPIDWVTGEESVIVPGDPDKPPTNAAFNTAGNWTNPRRIRFGVRLSF